MNAEELLATLTDLKANRRSSSEVDSILSPFRDKSFRLQFSFGSSSRTFGNRFDKAFENGYTVIGKLAGELEVAILFEPDSNTLVEGLTPGESLTFEVSLLDFDGLYQRPILGRFPTERFASEAEIEPELPEEPYQQGTIETATAIKSTQPVSTTRTEPIPATPSGESKVHKTAKPSSHYPSRFNLEDARKSTEESAHKDTRTPSGTKILFPIIGIAAVILSTWGWSNEYPFIHPPFGMDHWVLWSFVTFPLALGLPCLANRSWLALFLALVAFTFDIEATSTDDWDDHETSTGEMVEDTGQAGISSPEEAKEELETVQESPVEWLYDSGMLLQAGSLLLLSFGLASSRSTGGILVKLLAKVASTMFGVLSLLRFTENDLNWTSFDNFMSHQATFFFAGVVSCCMAIILKEKADRDNVSQ
ncbi:MAG: hypothetical protein HN627_05255 [Opitutae bacterium]|nr:hypothetical protein [Opitutae bacterium]